MTRSARVLSIGSVGAVVSLCIAVACSGGGGGGGGGGGDVVKPPSPPVFSLGAAAAAALTQQTIGAAGGTTSVTDASSPVRGLSITVPAGATQEDVTFAVQHADITSVSGLAAGAVATGKVISIEASGSPAWNSSRTFDLAVSVTLPYVAPAQGEESVRFYRINGDGTLEAAGFTRIDTQAKTITFPVRTFASTAAGPLAGVQSIRATETANETLARYVAIGLGTLPFEWWPAGKTLDTGFLPSVNGWYIPNYGSYYRRAQGGNCFGMVSFAQWYFKNGFTPRLHDMYRDAAKTDRWQDDATAIQLASRLQDALLRIWGQFEAGEIALQTPSSRQVALSWLGALYVTNIPAIADIRQVTVGAGGAKIAAGEHAVSIYRADIGPGGDILFHVYDPNKPAGDTQPRFSYTAAGFAIYNSGTTADDSRFKYNFFTHVGFHVGLSDALVEALKAQADAGFADNTVFPKITVLSMKGKANGEVVYDAATHEAKEGTTAQGEHKFVTSDTAVTVKGTILGGVAQDACCYRFNGACISCVVDRAHALVGSQDIPVPVANGAGTANDGSFSFDLPLKQGENEFILLGGKTTTNYWSAFYREIIESTASPEALTVTLSWDQDKSDVDLYVKEPDEAAPGSRKGDTVYYSHRRGFSRTNPYLDLDNTAGYGPEHYVAAVGTKPLFTDGTSPTDLYGDYTVKVHYYADHSGARTTQPITWHVTWRYLAYCPDPCAQPSLDGFWVSGSADGALSTAGGSGNCCSISRTGGDWSSAITLSYPKPNPSNWTIPPSTTVMLP